MGFTVAGPDHFLGSGHPDLAGFSSTRSCPRSAHHLWIVADGRWAWQAWRYEWEPDTSGEYTLCCRARDAARTRRPTVWVGTSAATATRHPNAWT